MVPSLARLLLRRIALVGLLVATPGLAWIDAATRSDDVVVDLERDGTAVVAHDLAVRVHGGPLETWTLAGVDADAEPLPGATVLRAGSGAEGGYGFPVEASVEGDQVRLRVLAEKGLRHGTFIFRFRYRTHLVRAGKLVPQGARAELRWQGPRIADGLDSVRVVYRVPRGEVQPYVPDTTAGNDGPGVAEDFGGVFLTTLRRAEDKDELELVRPHVARGEVVRWRARIDGRVIDGLTAPTATPAVHDAATLGSGGAQPTSPLPVWVAHRWAVLAALLVGLAYGLLAWWKARAVSAACRLRGVRPRALVPLGGALRGAAAGLLVAGAVGLGAATEQAVWAAVLLLGAMVFAAHLTPRAVLPLRGPGKWRPVEPRQALAHPTGVARLPGSFLDAGALGGFFVFANLLVAVVTLAVQLFAASPHRALMLALGSVVLLPIFCTGRGAELPADPAFTARAFLRWMHRKLSKDATLEVSTVARYPDTETSPDEVRLLVLPKQRQRGLTAIEIGVDYHQGPGGPLHLPFVIVRVREGSAAQDALPRGAYFGRGRDADERVAVLRPKIPTRGMCWSLLRSVVATLRRGPASGAPAAARQPAFGSLAESSQRGKASEASRASGASHASSTSPPGKAPSKAAATAQPATTAKPALATKPAKWPSPSHAT